MNQLHLHAIVLGVAIVLASCILLFRHSATSGEVQPEPRAPVVTTTTRPQARPKPAAAPADELHKALAKADEAMRQAREILQLASRTDDNQAQMLEVHKLIENAQSLMEPLPEDNVEVSERRRFLGQLSLDAAKVSGL